MDIYFSFSFFSDNNILFKKLLNSINNIKKYFPNSNILIFTHPNTPASFIKNIKAIVENLEFIIYDFKNKEEADIIYKLWSFYGLEFGNINIIKDYIVPIDDNEINFINEWIQSNYNIGNLGSSLFCFKKQISNISLIIKQFIDNSQNDKTTCSLFNVIKNMFNLGESLIRNNDVIDITLNESPKYIIVKGIDEFGSNLSTLITGILLSNLTKRKLYIDWRYDNIHNLDTTILTIDENINTIPDKFKSVSYFPDYWNNENINSSIKKCDDIKKLFFQLDNCIDVDSETMVIVNKFIIGGYEKYRKNMYKSLFKNDISNEYIDIVNDLNSCQLKIGIFLNKNESTDIINKYFKEIDTLITTQQDYVLFIVSNDNITFIKFVNKYKKNIDFIFCQHTHNKTLNVMYNEIKILAICDYIISIPSWITKTALYIKHPKLKHIFI